MRWFKHMTMSNSDEILSQLMDEFGTEGYGVWWLILEKIAQLMDETNRTFAKFSLKVWAKFTRISPKKLQKLVKFLEKNEVFLTEFEDGYLTINCPNLLKYRDEWTERQTKKKSKTRELLGSNSGVTPVQEAETDSESYSYINNDKNHCLVKPGTNGELLPTLSVPGFPPCPYQAIIDLYHEKLPRLPRVAKWTTTRNSHLQARWKEHPNLKLWADFFDIVAESNFLNGGSTFKDGRSFKATLDWLIKPENFAKTIEGKYDNQQRN